MLLERERSCLVLVDLQRNLLPAIDSAAQVVERARLLAAAAKRLQVPVLATEQYPAGLGTTVPELLELVAPGDILVKHRFAAGDEPAFRERLAGIGRADIVLAGCEAHVCLLQTALSLKAQVPRVAIVTDAVSSRRASDREAALRRLAAEGCELVTAEMVIFEWLRHAPSPEFRDLLPLLK
ncbi:MAG: isochorismatase family protein [Rhodospirillales bacterium]|nr:isochorismatase family protein [Rhodospirillales bacterium]